jgi:hypothetical protein
MLPCNLSERERDVVRKIVSDYGFIWPGEYPFCQPESC